MLDEGEQLARAIGQDDLRGAEPRRVQADGAGAAPELADSRASYAPALLEKPTAEGGSAVPHATAGAQGAISGNCAQAQVRAAGQRRQQTLEDGGDVLGEAPNTRAPVESDELKE